MVSTGAAFITARRTNRYAKKRFCTRSLQPQAATQQSHQGVSGKQCVVELAMPQRPTTNGSAQWPPPQQTQQAGARALTVQRQPFTDKASQGSNVAAALPTRTARACTRQTLDNTAPRKPSPCLRCAQPLLELCHVWTPDALLLVQKVIRRQVARDGCVHAADEPIKHALLAARNPIRETRLVVDGGPDPVRVLTLRRTQDRTGQDRTPAAQVVVACASSGLQQHLA